MAHPMPRRRRGSRRLLGVAALAGIAAVPATAGATIQVTGTGTVPAPDGVCVLAEAVANANADSAAGSADCAPGAGDDVIVFAADGEYPTTGMPPVAGTLTLSGAGRAVALRGSATHRVLTVPAGSDLTLHRLEVSGGTAPDCPGISVYVGCGGGVFNAGTLRVVESHITDNDAGADGFGGGIVNTGTAVITRSTVSANGARAGAGIADLGTLTVRESTIAGNRGGDGAGGLYAGGTATVSGSTLTGNTGGSPADPASIVTAGTGTARLVNSVVEGTAGAVNCAGDGLSASGAVIAFPAAGCPGTEADPRLGPLGPNGGPTPTAPPAAGSPLLDSADAGLCAATDQRGVARPQGPGCDVGAVEVRATGDGAPEVTATVTGTRGLDGWYVGDVAVRWTVTDPGSGVPETRGCDPVDVTQDTDGTTLTCTATGPSGTTTRSVTVRRDATAPQVALSAPEPGGRYEVGQDVLARYSCVDATSGVSACEGTTPDGHRLDTATPGPRTWQVTAHDQAGNTAVVAADHTVGFAYSGLLGTVKPPPRVNPAVAGASVVLRFRLGGDRGRDVLDASRPVWSAARSCRYLSKIPYGPRESAAFRLTYSTRHDAYHLRWFTARRWAGTCRELVVRFADGREQRVLFQFRR